MMTGTRHVISVFLSNYAAKVLPSFLVVLFTLLGAWLKENTARAVRLRKLHEAQERIQFWDTWMKAVSTGMELPTHLIDHARLQMIAAGELASNAFPLSSPPWVISKEEYAAYNKPRSWFKRAFLLYRQPTTHLWGWRLTFYSLLLELVLLVLQGLQLRQDIAVRHRTLLHPWGVLAFFVFSFAVLVSVVEVRRKIVRDQRKLTVR